MGLFSFKVEDAAGKVRSGKITADSLEAAQQRFQKLNLKVINLKEISSDLVVGAPKKVNLPEFPRMPGYDPTLQWDYRWYQLAHRYRWGKVLNVFLVVVFLVGLGIFVTRVKKTWVSNARRASHAEEYSVNVTVVGSLAIDEGTQDLGDATLYLSFPEVPCEFSKPWKDLEHPSPGRFKWELGVKTHIVPKTCVVTARKPRYRNSEVKQDLASPTGSTVTVELHLKNH